MLRKFSAKVVFSALPNTEESLLPALKSLNALAVLLCLFGLAFAEPVLTSFGSTPTIFHFYSIESPLLIFAFAASAALLPALATWCLWLVLQRLSERASQLFFALCCFALAFVWMVQIAKWEIGILSPYLLLAMATVFAVVFLASVYWFASLRSLLAFGGVSPLILIAAFLFFSPVSEIVTRGSATSVEVQAGVSSAPIVFIMLDEFPTLGLLNSRGELDKRRFPNLAQFNQDATWYRHYSVLDGKTIYSVPAILTGKTPRKVPATSANHPNSLFTWLAPTHHLAVFENITALCELSQCSEAGPGIPITEPESKFGGLLNSAVQLWLRRIALTGSREVELTQFQEEIVSTAADTGGPQTGVNAASKVKPRTLRLASVPRRFDRFLESFSVGPPTLYFLHLELPHIPWRFYPDGTRFRMPYDKADFEYANNDGGLWMVRLKEHRFLLQAQYVDTLLGIMFAKLKDLGLYDESLIVVTADHGRTFKYNVPSRELTADTLEGVAYAPLFIKGPMQVEGSVSDENIMGHDLLPTLAQGLDLSLPWPVDGSAAGSQTIASRGTSKFVNIRNSDNPEGVQLDFDDSVTFPNFENRWIGEHTAASSEHSLLIEPLAVNHLIGTAPPQSVNDSGEEVEVRELDQLLQPSIGKDRVGAVVGRLRSAEPDDKVLISINGLFVTASPLVTFREQDNTFLAMLPAGVLKKKNAVGVYKYANGALEKLTPVAR
ncbi:MAG: sulfatase-like hydrolase/transferase [Halioglobus sp.]